MGTNIKRIVFLTAVAIGVVIILSSAVSYKSTAHTRGTRSAGEEIDGTYYMNLTENMTAIGMYFSFDVYKINDTEISGGIVTASDIRGYSGVGEKEIAVQSIKDKLNNTVKGLISSAFPGDAFNVTSSEVVNSSLETTNPLDPIIIDYEAVLYFTNRSFNFTKPVGNLSDVLRGTLTMGATVNKSVALKAEPGFKNTFIYSLPLPYRFLQVLPGDNVTDVPDSKSTATWTIDNIVGITTKNETKYLKIQSRSPKPTTKEEILIYTTMNIVNFGDDVNINIKVDIRSINISKYTDMLPSTVTGLNFISSDGIRLMENNGLTTVTEMEDKSTNQSKKKVESDLNNIFNNPQKTVTLTYAWDRVTLNGYDVSLMVNTTPVNSYLNTTTPTGFSPDSLKITKKDPLNTQEQDVHEIIMGILRMGALAKKDFSLTAEPNRKVILNITGPQSPNNIWYVYLSGNITNEGATNLGVNIDGNKRKISFNIDNLNGISEKSEKVNLILEASSKSSEIIGRTSQDIQIWSTMDIREFDDIGMNVTVRVAVVNISDYKDIDIPGSVSNLTYITAECIRMVVKNGLASWDNITKGSENSSEDLENNLQKIFSYSNYTGSGDTPLNFKKMEIVESSKLGSATGGAIDIDNMPAYFTLNQNAAEVLITLTPMIPEGEKLQFNKSYIVGEDMKDKVQSIHKLSVGVIKMGADITTDFDIEADKGTKMFVDIIAPRDVTPTGTITVENTSATGTAYIIEVDYRAVGWSIDNLAGTVKKKGKISLNLASSSPLNITSESIEIETRLDMNDFYMSVNIDIVIKSVEVETYKIDIPEKVHNLKFITADGIRLAVENGLANWAKILEDIKNQNETKNVTEQFAKITEGLTITYNWDETTTTIGYEVSDMGLSRPALKVGGIGSSPMKVESEDVTIPREGLLGFINAGATSKFTNDKIESDYAMNIILVLPKGVTFTNPENLIKIPDIDDREAYKWSDPANKSISGILKSTKAPTYKMDKTEAMIVVDIYTINVGKGMIPNPKEISANINLDITAQIYYVDIETYGINLPENVTFKYINADAIRLALAINVTTLDNITNNIYKTMDELNKSVREGFNDPTFGFLPFEYDWSTLKDSSGKYIYDLNNMKDDVPIKIKLRGYPIYKMGNTGTMSSEESIVKPNLESAITLMKIPMSFPLSGKKGWDTLYKVIFPESIELSVPDKTASGEKVEKGKIGGRQYFECWVRGLGATEDTKVNIDISIGITPLFLLTIPLVKIIVFSLIAIIVLVIVYKVARKKGAKERKQKKKEEKMRKRAERIKRMELKRELKEFKPAIKAPPKKEAGEEPPQEPDIEPAEPLQEGDEFLRT